MSQPHTGTGSPEVNPLGQDGKLSSASAATSLKYARAQDLPSFPSVGIDTVKSGNKAANLASASHKDFEHWKPDMSTSASRAATLAAKDGGKVDLWQPQASGTGQSAAGIAMGKTLGPETYHGVDAESHKKALLAATLSVSNRNRSSSTPTKGPSYPDESNAARNALNAATAANRPTTENYPDYLEASRIKNMQGVSREMYTEKPPIALEVEEKKHQDALRASAISMAKQLYEIEKPHMDARAAGLKAARASAQAQTSTIKGPEDLQAQAVSYIHLQEAAQKLAAERLAKLDPDGVRAYREHYGYSMAYPRSKLGSKSRREQRGAGDDDDLDSSEDEAYAVQVRGQMSQLNQQLSSVDEQKRQKDRADLLAVAQARVSARMHDMDTKVLHDTGKVPPSIAAEWEAKAQAQAAANSETRMQNHGKINLGGGRFMDQAEINAIAAERMKPTLDEITENAEKRRARDEEIRLDIERQKEEAAAEKKRQQDAKDIERRDKEAEKLKARQLNEEDKQRRKEEEKAAKDKKEQEKRQKELEKRQAKIDAKLHKDARSQPAAYVAPEPLPDELARGVMSREPIGKPSEEPKEPESTGESVSKTEEPEAADDNTGEVDHAAGAAALVSDEPHATATRDLEDKQTQDVNETAETSEEAPAEHKEIEPAAQTQALTTTAASSPEDEEKAAVTTAPESAKKESSFRGLISKLKRSSKSPEEMAGADIPKDSHAEPEAAVAEQPEAEKETEAELPQATAKGKEPAESISPVASEDEDAPSKAAMDETSGTAGETVSPQTTTIPRTSSDGTPLRSRFQEDL